MLGSAAGEVEAEAADGEAFPVAAAFPGPGIAGLSSPRTPAAGVRGDRTGEARHMVETTRSNWAQGEGRLPIHSCCYSTPWAPSRVLTPDPAVTQATTAQTAVLQKKSSYSFLV